ncbi:MAG: hypothetical protein K940chlam7_01073 [Chlamydiae bacterium]|nr:hypothetical protein [Chlamydiota bacterium]
MDPTSSNPMVPNPADSTTYPIPTSLKETLPFPTTPWKLNLDLFERVRKGGYTDMSYKTCEVLPSDPEYAFVFRFFVHQKPPAFGIRRIICIHNPSHTKQFEGEIKNIEQEAEKFPPQWKNDGEVPQREAVIKRWEVITNQFSPIQLKGSERTDALVRAKVLPLWHGSSEAKCKSICSSGFTFFGKHHHFHPAAKKGSVSSTDVGYFGSGIYFTTSAQYSAMYSEGHMLLGWVSLREPYPVVSDVPHPNKGTDMKKLMGKAAYQEYNAHYIPVAPIDPNPLSMEYFPCMRNQRPKWDELVVFQRSHTLPRFWIELGVDLPRAPDKLYCFQECYSACRDGVLDTVKLWLRQNPERLFERGINGETYLHAAAQGGRIDVIRWLASEGPGLLSIKTYGDESPLDVAEKSGRKDVEALLRELMKVPPKKEGGGGEPAPPPKPVPNNIYEACEFGNIGFIEKAIQNLSWHESKSSLLTNPNAEGIPPLLLAALANRVDVVLFLLKQGVSVHQKAVKPHSPEDRDIEAYQAIHIAAQKGYKDLVSLLATHRAEINGKARYGRTPLHMSAHNGRLEATQLLLLLGADCNAQTTPDDDSVTPLHAAVTMEYLDIARVLLDQLKIDPNIKDSNGRSPLYYAVRAALPTFVRLICESPKFQRPTDPEDPNHLDKLLESNKGNKSKATLREKGDQIEQILKLAKGE